MQPAARVGEAAAAGVEQLQLLRDHPRRGELLGGVADGQGQLEPRPLPLGQGGEPRGAAAAGRGRAGRRGARAARGSPAAGAVGRRRRRSARAGRRGRRRALAPRRAGWRSGRWRSRDTGRARRCGSARLLGCLHHCLQTGSLYARRAARDPGPNGRRLYRHRMSGASFIRSNPPRSCGPRPDFRPRPSYVSNKPDHAS